jgi:hypothetical protein
MGTLPLPDPDAIGVSRPAQRRPVGRATKLLNVGAKSETVWSVSPSLLRRMVRLQVL